LAIVPKQTAASSSTPHVIRMQIATAMMPSVRSVFAVKRSMG